MNTPTLPAQTPTVQNRLLRALPGRCSGLCTWTSRVPDMALALHASRLLLKRQDGRVSPNGLPSLSRQITHRSPGWITSPPSAATCATAASRSGTTK